MLTARPSMKNNFFLMSRILFIQISSIPSIVIGEYVNCNFGYAFRDTIKNYFYVIFRLESGNYNVVFTFLKSKITENTFIRTYYYISCIGNIHRGYFKIILEVI